MSDKRWVKFLRILFKISGREYCFFGKGMASFYYIDANSEYVVVPKASTESGIVERQTPRILHVTSDYSMRDASNVEHVGARFFEYMGKKQFKL